MGEARNDYLIMAELAKRLGYGTCYPQTEEELIRFVLDGSGYTVEDVQASEGEGNRLFQEIRRQGVMRELPLVVATLRAFADGKVRIEGGRVVDAGGRPIGAYDLTQEIDRLVGSA